MEYFTFYGKINSKQSPEFKTPNTKTRRKQKFHDTGFYTKSIDKAKNRQD